MDVVYVEKNKGEIKVSSHYLSEVSEFTTHCKEPLPKIRNKYSQKRNCAAMQSQFPPSCVCERFIYSIRSICLFCCRKYGDRAWDEAGQFPEKEYINEIFAAVQYCSFASEKRFHCTTVSC